MNKLVTVLVFLSSLSSLAIAGETTTDCLMMRESNERNNPKENLGTQRPRPRNVRGSATSQ
jgi:hypothetical protein